jgi:hypothetical protein
MVEDEGLLISRTIEKSDRRSAIRIAGRPCFERLLIESPKGSHRFRCVLIRLLQ